MLLDNFIKKSIIKYYQSLKYLTHKILQNNGQLCRIEEINLLKKTVIVYCRYIDAPIKLRFDEIMNDLAILSNLSAKHAAWIGYYYGQYYSSFTNEKNNCNIFSVADLSRNYSPEKFNIIMLNRHGELIYSDQDNHATYTILPMQAMINAKIIMNFNSIQACYIGILAGIASVSIRQTRKQSSTSSAKGQLRIVK